MPVEQFDPSTSNNKPKNSKIQARTTTTLETPVKIIEEQLQASNTVKQDSKRAVSIGFISLG